MHVLNRFSSLHFAGQNKPQAPAHSMLDDDANDFDYSEIALPESQAAHRVLMESLQLGNQLNNQIGATDCFDDASAQHQIQLPLDPTEHQQLMDQIELSSTHKKAQALQIQTHSTQRMRDDLNKKIAQQEKEYTKHLKEMALLAYKHSLLTEKNHMLLYGAVKNDNWEAASRKLKHPPEQAQGLGLGRLLDTETSTWGSLGFDWKVHSLYSSVMGDLADKKPAGTMFRTMSDNKRKQYHQNEKTQQQLEQQMEQFRAEKLKPLQTELQKTLSEMHYFQELLTPQTQPDDSQSQSNTPE